jgi:NAD(P)-dependent dehydrogenase (short-subunit alcohol dehydrogenase family)
VKSGEPGAFESGGPVSGEAGSKTVLITGAAHRIGRALALRLAAKGWFAVIHYCDSRQAAALLEGEIQVSGGTAATVAADLASLDEVLQLVPRAAEGAGAPVCCLINNASLFLNDRMGVLDAAQWQKHMDVNLRAPVFLSQSFAAHLPPGMAGNIINIIDQRVLKPSPDFFSYTVSKSGLAWVTRTMAQALGPHIRVNAIAPGPVLRSVHQTEEEFEAEGRATLLGRGSTPEEIAAAVQFLLETPSITGQMICLDGGQHLT